MTLQEIQIGDVVRVDDDHRPWRVTKRSKKGMLSLVSVGTMNKVSWTGVYEFRVMKVSRF